jgi:hypothetical protein
MHGHMYAMCMLWWSQVYSAATLDIKSPYIDSMDPREGLTAAYHAIRGASDNDFRNQSLCLQMLIEFGASDVCTSSHIYYTMV